MSGARPGYDNDRCYKCKKTRLEHAWRCDLCGATDQQGDPPKKCRVCALNVLAMQCPGRVGYFFSEKTWCAPKKEEQS